MVSSEMFGPFIVLCLIGLAICGQQDDIFLQNATTCGVMSTSTGLVQGGFKSEREAFPWLVNIFTKYLAATLYAGSGSLISDRHILCAANSVAYENYLGESLELDPEKVRGLQNPTRM